MSKLSWKCIYHTNKIEQIFFPDTTENENKISALSFSREISPLNLKKKKKKHQNFFQLLQIFLSVFIHFCIPGFPSYRSSIRPGLHHLMSLLLCDT